MRQLVTIRTVSELIPIEGADRIELARVDGWQCVVKKGDFTVGDPGVYFEIDSILPSTDPRFAFLEPRKFRIKSMRLRGALSQGLLMPAGTLSTHEWERFKSGEILQDVLGVQKYEVPLPMSGEQKGTFPTHLVPKTDQERIQNIPGELEERKAREFEITEKLDGTSCTIYAYNEIGHDAHGDIPPEMRIHVGVCSRNWEMKVDDSNVYSKILSDTDLVAKLRKLERNIAIQGEIVGPGVQGNKYKRGKQEFYVFDIYDIDARQYVDTAERMRLMAVLDLTHVPVPSYFDLLKDIPEAKELDPSACELSLDVVLNMADGTSVLFDTPREGLVFKHLRDSALTFKAISNKFLLKSE